MLGIGELTAVVDVSWASIPTSEMTLHVSWGEYTVEGTGGTLHLRKDGLLRLITDTGEEKYQFPRDSILRGYQAAQQHFIDCLRTGAEPETSGPQTRKTMELVFGAYDSAEHDRVYRVGHDLARLV
jgi:predicted dehydrogenase